MKKWMYTLLTLIATLIIAGCTPSQEKATTSSSVTQTQTKAKEEVKATIELKESDKLIEKKTVTFKEDATLYQIMKDNFTIVDKDGFLTSINEKEQDQKANKYWMFTVNGKMGEKGAKETPVKNGDRIIFTLDTVR